MIEENSSAEKHTVLDDLVNVIKSKPEISYLKNSVTEGTFYKKGFISTCGSIEQNINSSWIRIININRSNFNKFLLLSPHKQNILNVFDSRYNEYLKDKKNLIYMGCNIATDLKINGYHYNICDIFSSHTVENNQETPSIDKSISRNIYKLIFVGEKNYLIAFITIDAILYVDKNLLEKFRRTNYTLYKDIVLKILSIYGNANSIFFQLNTMNFDKLIFDSVSEYILPKFNQEVEHCSIINPENIDIFSDNAVIDNLFNKLKDYITNYVNKILVGSRWGINNQYSYKNLMDKFIQHTEAYYRNKIDNAFATGLLYGEKIKLCGWVISDIQKDEECTWEKTVNIIPCRANYRNTIYNIDPNWKQNPYHIDKLYITTSGKMFCEGNHPNVSSGLVCMGDIRGKISLSDVDSLTQNLNRCENLLTLINFDSAYDCSKRELVLSHSTVAGYNELSIDNEYIGENEKIIDVQFEDDENIENDEITTEDIEIVN